MSYLVLARKYRPTTFSEVVGQEHVTRTLANAFAKNRVHHAFLFCGPRGVGKTTLARILGKALNCEQGPTAEPCGECSACQTITDGTAIDYFEMDGASNRGIDNIRELTEAVRYQPAMLRTKVYVIDEVHMLTTEAFNALLKTLEEPPPHVRFVLATTEPHKVPNTILSRCQRYDFKLVPGPRLAQHLNQIFEAEKLAIEPGATGLLVRESGGSVRDALSLSDQVISYVGEAAITEAAVAEVLGVADRALTRSLVGALAAGDAGTALEVVEQAITRGVDEVQLARAVVRYIRDLAVLQVAPGTDTLVEGSAEERADMAEQAAALDRARVTQMFERMVRACDDLGQSQHPRLVLDLAFIDVAALEPLLPLGGLVDRLVELERRLFAGGSRPRRPGRSGPGPGQGPSGGRRQSPVGDAPTRHPARPESDRQSRSPVPVPVPVVVEERSEAQAPGRSNAADPRPGPPDDPETGAARGGGARSSGESDRPQPPASDSPPRTAVISPRPPGESAPPHPGESAPPHPGEVSAGPPPATPVEIVGPDRAIAGPNSLATSADRAPREAREPARPRPAAPAPAAAVPSTDPLTEWARVLDALSDQRKFTLTGLYEHAKVLSWNSGTIELGFAPNMRSVADMARGPDYVASLEGFLSARYGHSIHLDVRVLDEQEAAAIPEARSVVDVNRERADAERKKREAEVRMHPIYTKVIETFGTPIKEEINTDV